MTDQPKIFWPTTLAHRWGKTLRTVSRWRRENLIPPPDVCIAGHRGWSLELVEKIERGESAQAAERSDRAA